MSKNARGSGYHFYETSKGFHFRSYESMLAYQGLHARDEILTLAYEIFSSRNLKLSTKIKNVLITTLAIYSGFSGLAGGQYFDLTFENKKISKKKLLIYKIIKLENYLHFVANV